MTYTKLRKLTEGKHLPICGKNDDGENVIIEHCSDKGTYANQSFTINYFKLTTAQHNGWARHNYIHENGTTEEFYTRHN
jgi:hypothetical protein